MLLARRASDEISWGHDVFFRSVPAAHTLVRGVDGRRLRRHSADSTLPPLWPTGSSSGWLPSIPARSFSASPSDSTSRWTPCPPRLPSGPASRYSRFWIWRPPSERQWDSNPPDHVAAQRTLRSPRTPVAPRATSPSAYTRHAAPTRAAQTGLSCSVPLRVRVLRPIPRRDLRRVHLRTEASQTWPSPRHDRLGSRVVNLSRLQASLDVAARVLAPSVEACDTPLGPQDSHLAPGVCYSALRCLPRRDLHPLETNDAMTALARSHLHDAPCAGL
jgi:hypothetical protein